MKIRELLRTLEGNENTEVLEYPNGAKLYWGTAKNIPVELMERQIVKTKLLPQTYLGVALYVA